MSSARKWGKMETAIALEVVKVLTQTIFQLQRQNNLTDEQIDQAFEESRQEVRDRPGDALPDA